MVILPDPGEANTWCARQGNQGLTMGFVPTMGALHAGHFSLLQRAARENDLCCASIFVNPLQFNDPNDLSAYPDTLEADIVALENHGCDMVFRGTLSTFFPEVDDHEKIRKLDPGPVAHGLEGSFRPGHLEGVVTIVDRLFRTVGNCRAYFGEKDYQQALVVRDLADALAEDNIFISVIICPTVRARNGLALSSRNLRLSDSDRNLSSALFRALVRGKHAWSSGIRSKEELETIVADCLAKPGIRVEYAAVRDPEDWTSNAEDLMAARGFVAAYVSGIRLIDTMAFGSDRMKPDSLQG